MNPNGACYCCGDFAQRYVDRHGRAWCDWCHDNGWCTDLEGHQPNPNPSPRSRPTPDSPESHVAKLRRLEEEAAIASITQSVVAQSER